MKKKILKVNLKKILKIWGIYSCFDVFIYYLNFFRYMSIMIMYINRMVMVVVDIIIMVRFEMGKEFVVKWWIFKWKCNIFIFFISLYI